MRSLPTTSRAFGILFGILTLFVLVTPALAAPSDLDPLFGTLGKVVSSPDGSNRTWGAGTALQADGKIVMVGVSSDGSISFIIARYNSDGSLDKGFGKNGLATVPFTCIWVTSAAIVVQPDGKIVVAGIILLGAGIPPAPPIYEVGVARINSDGSPDMTFDGDGRANIDFNTVPGMSSARESISALKIAGDGKIAVGGSLTLGTDHRFIFAKLNSDGSPDAAFGNNGRYVDPDNNGSNSAAINDIVAASDGSIVGVGYILNPSGNFRIVMKVNAAGISREWTRLQGDSVFSTEFKHGYFGITPIADGKFIVAGKADRKVVVARLKSDGTLDFPFANPNGLPEGQALSVEVQADGKIVANLSTNTAPSFSLIRFNSDGTLDTGFGVGGIATTTVLNSGDGGGRVLVQPDGKILVGGYAQIAGSPTQYFFAMVRYRGGELVRDTTQFDYDGDDRADVSVFRPLDGNWYIDRSTGGFAAYHFGNPTDRLVPADYDGDDKADVAVYHDGEWWIIQSSNNVVKVITFGVAEDKPQPGDYDGDGLDDIAVWRPSNGVWYVLRTTDGGYHSVAFGMDGDVPQRGDYDDDGKIDYAVFRPSAGTWYIQRSTGGYAFVPWGADGDIPVASDYDGDNTPDVAVFRPSNGVWYILKSEDGQVIDRLWGLAGDVPIPADYDGDGKSDIAIFRPSNGLWCLIRSTAGQAIFPFGTNGDRPTPSAYNP